MLFFYILLLGEVAVTKGSPPRPITNLGPGDCFGEMSFLTGSPRTANVIANSSTAVVIKMSQEMVQELHIKIREKIKDRLIKRLVERLDLMNGFVISTKSRLPGSVSSPHNPTDIP
jgi:serine/threonine-protein kinase